VPCSVDAISAKADFTNGRRIAHVLSSANPLFESAARVYNDKVIAVVLSGTGADASAGVAEVHRHGGLVVVQAPDSARWAGMPVAALSTGFADVVLPGTEIGEWLAEHVSRHTSAAPPPTVRLDRLVPDE
jgi:chemotaxis response regulator CheB